MMLSLEQQMVKLASPSEPLVADTSTDLQFQWALQRRGLAYDQCSEHELWVQQPPGQLTREPPRDLQRSRSTRSSEQIES